MKHSFSILLVILLLGGCTNTASYSPVEEGRWQPHITQSGLYRVKEGDTLYSVAWAFGLDYRTLATINHLNPPYKIQANQLLHVKTVKRWTKAQTSAAQPYQIPITPVAINSQPSSLYTRHKNREEKLHWSQPAKGRIIEHFNHWVGGNRGINIQGQYGEPIRAAASGIVVYSGAGVRGYGNLILIKHNDNYLSAYAFNKQNLVKEGVSVHAGQEIAEMGRDDAGKIMLHFEIRYKGEPINPLRYL